MRHVLRLIYSQVYSRARSAGFALLVGIGVVGSGRPIQAASVLPEGPRVFAATMEVTNGKPYVIVSINGQGRYRFILDTGTGADAMITSALAAQLGLPSAGAARLYDPTGQGGQSAPLRRIDLLTVAGIDFHGIKAIEHALPSTEGECDGMLGFTLFRDWLLTLDYPRRRMTLVDGELKPDGDRAVHSMRLMGGVPVVRLTVNSIDLEAMVDSGGAGLSVPETLVPRLRFSASPTIFAVGESLSTRFQIKVGRLAGSVRLGDVTLEEPWVEINSAFPIGNFGSCPMQHFAISFDQRNLRLRFDGPRKRISLGVTPGPVRLSNMPEGKPRDVRLVPVG